MKKFEFINGLEIAETKQEVSKKVISLREISRFCNDHRSDIKKVNFVVNDLNYYFVCEKIKKLNTNNEFDFWNNLNFKGINLCGRFLRRLDELRGNEFDFNIYQLGDFIFANSQDKLCVTSGREMFLASSISLSPLKTTIFIGLELEYESKI